MKRLTILILGISAVILGWMVSFDIYPNSSPYGENYPKEKQNVTVFGKSMSYVELGNGSWNIVFLHGNPTSSYLWRNIMPFVQDKARCIAPDLIGMGDSEKLPLVKGENPDERYSFSQHSKYLEEFLKQVKVDKNVILVTHDWGGALGFDWANRNREKVKGIAFAEAVINPNISTSDLGFPANLIFRAFRTKKVGEFLILNRNAFVEHILPGGIIRKLSSKEIEEYRKPFLSAGEDRRPTLTWSREICFNGEPSKNQKIFSDFMKWFEVSKIPKLWINVEPGTLIKDKFRDYIRTFPNLTEITLHSFHYVQEDAPIEFGEALSQFVDNTITKQKK